MYHGDMKLSILIRSGFKKEACRSVFDERIGSE